MMDNLINITLRRIFPFHYELLDLGIANDFDEAVKVATAVKKGGVFGRDFLIAIVNLSNERMRQILFDDLELFLSKLPAEYDQRDYALAFAETIEELVGD